MIDSSSVSRKSIIEPIIYLLPGKILINFGVGDCVSDVTRHAKIQISRPSGASRQMNEVLLSRGF